MTAVLFDLDGTLLDTLDDLTASVNAALAAFSLPPRTREEVRKFLGNGAERLIRLSLPGEKTDPPAEEVLKTFREHYNAHCLDRTRPYDGILEALGALSMPAAIVSNKPDSAVKPLCARFFPGVPAFGETADCPRKPAPDMLFRGLEALGADRCVYVGDSEVDVLTAANAGVPCLSVLWGFRGKAELAAAGGKHFCEDPRKLVSAVRQLIREKEGSQNGK